MPRDVRLWQLYVVYGSVDNESVKKQCQFLIEQEVSIIVEKNRITVMLGSCLWSQLAKEKGGFDG